MSTLRGDVIESIKWPSQRECHVPGCLAPWSGWRTIHYKTAEQRTFCQAHLIAWDKMMEVQAEQRERFLRGEKDE